jgi:hypothetical protein
VRYTDVITYGLYLFFPLLIPAIILVPGAFLSLLIAPSLPALSLCLLLVGAPTAVTLGLYLACSKLTSFIQRLIINYFGWLLVGGSAIYLCVGAIGGTSMAVVEGVASERQLRGGTLSGAIITFLFAQVIVVPWSVWATRRTSQIFQPANKNQFDVS